VTRYGNFPRPPRRLKLQLGPLGVELRYTRKDFGAGGSSYVYDLALSARGETVRDTVSADRWITSSREAALVVARWLEECVLLPRRDESAYLHMGDEEAARLTEGLCEVVDGCTVLASPERVRAQQETYRGDRYKARCRWLDYVEKIRTEDVEAAIAAAKEMTE